MPRDTLSILIPVLNEADGLDDLVARLKPTLDALPVRSWEVVFVDDGSSDGTMASLKALNAREPRYKALSLSRNFGKEHAIAAGLHHVSGDAVVLLDADLQHPPELLSKFVQLWREGYQIVYGQRQDRKTDGLLRRLFSIGFYALFQALSRTHLPDGAGDFRLLDRQAIDAMNRLGERERFNKGLYSWIGYRSIGVPYEVAERAHGTAKWSPRRLFHFAMDGILSFSTVPLRIWSYLGLLISLAAFTYALYFLIWTLVFGVDLPGFPSLIISIMMLSGVQLISLGVLGEYVGRIYEEVKGRPLYLVAETVGLKPQASGRPSDGAIDGLSGS
jgi:polyisoprenyl-phosphate glycosyltransferase